MKPHERFAEGLNISEIAALFDIDPRTVGKILYGLEPDGAVGGRGHSTRYMGATILAGIKRYYGVRVGENETSLEAERIRLTAAQANRAELELAISTGELLPVDDVIRETSKALTAIKASVMNLPARIAPAVFNQKTSRDVENVAKGIVISALSQLETDIKAIPGNVSGDEAAAYLDDLAVGAEREDAVA
jgi:phage terminase Nu1 subunit (DNA packaging protein)